jgi:hypothetical protein
MLSAEEVAALAFFRERFGGAGAGQSVRGGYNMH